MKTKVSEVYNCASALDILQNSTVKLHNAKLELLIINIPDKWKAFYVNTASK